LMDEEVLDDDDDDFQDHDNEAALDDSSSDVFKSRSAWWVNRKLLCWASLAVCLIIAILLIIFRDKLKAHSEDAVIGDGNATATSVLPAITTANKKASTITLITSTHTSSSSLASSSTRTSSSSSSSSSTTATTTTTTTNEPSPSPPPPPPPKSGTIANLVSQDTLDRAVSSCTGHYSLYSSLTSGFQSPLPGGLPELALLLGNMAWESGGFAHTSEQACQDGSCAYGWYYGRGYIQLTWHDNYQAAASFLGRQDIVDNPNVVAYDEYTNWQVVEWYWTQKVSPVLRYNGYSIGASVGAINGGIECGGNVWGGRINFIQCFANQLGTYVDGNTWC
ncbi:UNVERIFIED_CONTAM: hypothetical protein HDU68_006814, partial [Siphonaria sp. JEL0065]